MKRERPTVHCTCHYCGTGYSFTARSKADAKRMTGRAVCERETCRQANSMDNLRELSYCPICDVPSIGTTATSNAVLAKSQKGQP